MLPKYVTLTVPPKIRTRPPPPTPTPRLHAPLHSLPPPRRRQHPRPNLLLRPRHNGHLPRRLLWHLDGRARHRLPFQHHRRAHVLGQHDELFGHGVAVWEARGGAVERGGAGCVCRGADVGGSVYGGDLCEKGERGGEEGGVGGRGGEGGEGM